MRYMSEQSVTERLCAGMTEVAVMSLLSSRVVGADARHVPVVYTVLEIAVAFSLVVGQHTRYSVIGLRLDMWEFNVGP